jgi:hypothetical protein
VGGRKIGRKVLRNKTQILPDWHGVSRTPD